MFYRHLLGFALVFAALFFSSSTILGGVFFAPQTSHAQINFINSTEGQALRVTVLPRYPKAFEKVSVSVEDFSRDINGLNISWSQGGRVVAKGIGMKSFGFTAGALGSVGDVTVTIDGSTHTIPIRPAEVDLLWQASSYTPPFYKGKALHTNQDAITVVAEPFFVTRQGVRVNPTTLVYKWKQNGIIAEESSGYGRKIFTVRPSALSKPIDVEVEVTSTTGEYAAIGRTVITETTPKLLVYEDSPLYGIRSEHALNGKGFLFGDKSEATFVAIPLFFSAIRPSDPNLEYTWSQNSVRTNQESSEVVFRAPAEGGGTATVRASVKHKTKYLQGADAPFVVEFKSTAGETSSLLKTFETFKDLKTSVAFAQAPPPPNTQNTQSAPTVESTLSDKFQTEYVPLVPLPGVGSGSNKSITNFSQYVRGMFQFLIGLAALLAVVQIIFGGIEYMTTDAISGKSAGKERINQALLGLLLAIGAWLVLSTIDPNILKTTLDTAEETARDTN